MNFVPLHVRSGYSFLRSALTVDRILDVGKKMKFSAMGIADINVAYGWMEFAEKAHLNNIKPILGVDLEYQDITFSFYALSEDGYRNIAYLVYAKSCQELTVELLKKHSKGIALILNTRQGILDRFLKEENSQLVKIVRDYAGIYSNFFLGIEINSDNDLSAAEYSRKFADKYGYETIAFPKIVYANTEDAYTIDILEAISHDNHLDDNSSPLPGPYYFLESGKIEKFYTEKEIENTIILANIPDYAISSKRGHLIQFPSQIPGQELLAKLANAGLKKLNLSQNDEYQKRLDYELSVIHSMGYDDYFLVVQDYVNYARQTGIPVGPGRGSAAGSLVSYALEITTIDPLPENLLFERFLNPERKTMPDIDIDFADDRREEIVDYLKNKYGKSRVANIVTFQTIGARQSLRDVARVFDFPIRHIELLSKSLGIYNYSLREAYRKIPSFKRLIDSDPFYLRIVTLASKIEGLPRQSGMHAAGIVLSNDDLFNSIPVQSDSNGNLLVQYEMNYLESQGYLKMDILGLTNLSTIQKCLININANYETTFTIDNIPYDEKEVFELISNKMTMGIFQLESTGMVNAIEQIKPSSFEDIVAILALFRPGPMQNIPLYARRKEGREPIVYAADALKPILESTYGIIVYQEQIMQIAQVLAGMSLAEADLFRRAISKKDAEKLANLKATFISGTTANGYQNDLAEKIFDTIYQFADYGFNKSHSVAYAKLACQMAYLKVHYPAEFYASILDATNSTNDTKFQSYLSEMRRRNLKIFGPSINESDLSFVVKNRALIFPIVAIHGINNQTSNNILKERSLRGPFKSFADFITRLQPYKITINQVEKLIDAGAFDQIYDSRASLRKNAPLLFSFASLVGSNNPEQINLTLEKTPAPAIERVEDDPLENLNREYETLGVMLSENPLKYKQEQISQKGAHPLADILNSKNDIPLVGIIKSIKVIRTKAGKPMAFVKLYDQNSELDFTFFPSTYQQYLSILEKNNIIIVIARQDYQRPNTYIVNKVELLED